MPAPAKPAGDISEAGDRRKAYIPRRKHSIILSGGLGIASADTRDSVFYQGSLLQQGFDLRTAFAAELSYIYRIHRHISMEPFINYMAEKRALIMSGDKYSLDYNSFGAGLNLLGVIPLGNFDLYGLIGGLYAYHHFDFKGIAAPFSESGGSFGFQAGAGVDYIIKNRIRIGAR